MWMNFGIKDIIDVLLVAFFLYQTYKLMKSSGTLGIFSGVVSFVVVWILTSQILEMRLMGAILDKFISVGFVVLIVLFQDEIRRFLLALGSHKGWKFLAKPRSPILALHFRSAPESRMFCGLRSR
jgi:DNA integrity scanning protein DisA with diadenylate cyclase activity